MENADNKKENRTTVLNLAFCVSAFWKGCGGTFFAKKVPPQSS